MALALTKNRKRAILRFARLCSRAPRTGGIDRLAPRCAFLYPPKEVYVAKVNSGLINTAPSGAFGFQPANSEGLSLVLALAGPPGAGKTYTALHLAQAIADERGIAVIDTEHSSSQLLARKIAFDVAPLRSYLPRNYIELLKLATGRYSVIVVDSFSHSWNGDQGILDIAGGDIRGWKVATPEYRALMSAVAGMRDTGTHIICTLRSEVEYRLEPNAFGKTQVVNYGLQPIHRKDTPYEFDVFAHINRDHEITASKTRYPSIDGKTYTADQIPDLAADILADIHTGGH